MTDDGRTNGSSPVPGWYWAVAIAALLWEAVGCYMYLTQVSMEAADLAALPAAQRDVWTAMPVWATAAYAAAVWVGLTGAVGLLLRQSWARLAFLVSLVAVLIQFGWTFLATDIMNTVGSSSIGLPLFIIFVAILLLWFSGVATRRGWLRG